MSLRAWLARPRPSRGHVMRYGCPGDECAGLFRTADQARDHAGIARIIGSHESGPQRRARRERSRALRQLRGGRSR